MRFKYSRFAKLFGVAVLFIIVAPYFLKSIDKNEKSEYRSDSDSERAKFPVEPVDIVLEPPVKEVLDNDDEYSLFKEGTIGNYEPVNLKPRIGPGENGEPFELPLSEKDAGDRSVSMYGFNMVASDKISMDRRIKDTRPAECKYWHYPKKLPTAGVVVVFHNEGWSVLMRTVHSVINTSPAELLKDIVLVDDFSNDEDLKSRLEDYIKRFNGLVKLHRTTKREGLVQARVIGAEKSAADVIVVLDAHCECVVNWLPPLLARIKLNRKALAVPIVDGLDWKTLQHTEIYGGESNRGIFEWGFLYKETIIPREESLKHKYKTEPYWSPTHAGGLLAIEKNWFFELGGYDPGIKIWGAEQYELSFKVWQCGGVVEWVPCSHVAHAYRGPRTRSVHPPGGNPFQSAINHMRLAEVWMDEYKEYYYIREPHLRKLYFGDVSAQKALREKLQCKPFKWFMENIAYDLTRKFPLPPKNKVWGECSNLLHKVCLDVRGANFGEPIGVSGCHRSLGNQLFRLNVEGELSTGEHCFVSDRSIVKKKFCLDYQGVWNPIGEWDYDMVNQTMKSNKVMKCLETDGQKLYLSECNSQSPAQKWIWKETYIS